MKIGILTFHAPCNFGANLQAFCSCRYLSSLGHSVKVINYLREGDLNPSYCHPSQKNAHWLFSQRRIPVTRQVTENEIIDVIKEELFDIVFVGSDAVWSKRDRKSLKVFTGQWFINNVITPPLRLLALSPASMSYDYQDLNEQEKENFKKGLLNFSAINTRDNWTRQIINRDIMGYEYITSVNPDPVFLLNSLATDDWLVPKDLSDKKYILMTLPKYTGRSLLLMQKWMKKFRRLLSSQSIKLIELPRPEGYCGINEFDYSIPFPLDPIQWYLWIKHSSGFIGMRFHAIVSCLSANVPFYSLDNYGKTGNLTNLLNRFGIHHFDYKSNPSSKIENLLGDSGLERNRINGTLLYMIPPKAVFNKILHFNFEAASRYTEKQITLFKHNIDKMLE